MMRVFIVEDNPTHLAVLKAKLSDIGFTTVGACQSSETALKELKEVSADVILMDINLHGDDSGISLAHQMQAEYDIPIIYVTAMANEHVIQQAINTSPAGYLSKPVDPVELKANIELAVQKHQQTLAPTRPNKDYLTVRVGQKLQKVHFKDISHFKVESKNYVTLVDQHGKKFAVRGSLKKIVDTILPEGFLRTHHSHGINLEYVEFIDESSQNIHLLTGELIPIGKIFKKEVYQKMNIT